MSENEIMIGQIAKLKRSISDDERDDASEDLYCRGFSLSINYEGTLLIFKESGGQMRDHFDFKIIEYDKKKFVKTAKKAGFPIVKNSIRPFVDLWYNGVDSNRDCLTLEKFNSLTN